MYEEIKVYRNELKYLISIREYYYLREIFKDTLTKDEYGINGDYWIRSLYLDTVYDKDYTDKIIGVKDRKKIRLRIYDTNTEKVKLEIKNRFDQYMLKETATISREDALLLSKGEYIDFRRYNNKTLNKVFYIMNTDYYQPSAIIDYEREAYTCPINSIRITFDKNIRATVSNFDLFNNEISTVNLFNEPLVVLEVKYNKMLPKWIRDILSSCQGDRLSVSKYCIAKEYLKY